MPTLTASAPASISACAPSAVAILPAITWTSLDSRLMRLTASSTRDEWPCAVSTTITSTPASISCRCAHSRPRRPWSPRRRAAGPARPCRHGDVCRLLDILDGDQADAAILVIDHQQLLDAVLMQQPLGLVLADAFAHGDEIFLRHQFGNLLARIGGKAHVAVGEDADQLAGHALGRRRSPPECRRSRGRSSAPAHPPASRPGRWSPD